MARKGRKPGGERPAGTLVGAPAAIPNARRLQRHSQVLEQKYESTPKCSVEAGNNRRDSGCARAKYRKTGGDSHGGNRVIDMSRFGTRRSTHQHCAWGIMVGYTNRKTLDVNPCACGFSGVLRMPDRAPLHDRRSCDRRGSLPMDLGRRRWHQLTERRHVAIRQEGRGVFDP
jgi:hypothetical protein